MSYGVTKKKKTLTLKINLSNSIFVTLRIKIHFSHVICMLSFFFYIFAMSHHRTQSNFYLPSTHKRSIFFLNIYMHGCVFIYT